MSATRSISRVVARLVVAGLFGPLAAACSRDVPVTTDGTPVLVPFTVPDLPADGMHQVVVVMDSGFDLSLPQFAGKIAGGYTVTCAAYPDPAPTTFDAAKAAALASYAVKDTRCRLVPGITLRRSSKLDALRGDLMAWNAGVIAHDFPPSLLGIESILDGEATFGYHGTWTASLIAYQNPDVRIVFVETPLALPGSKPTCETADQLNLIIALAKDPDIRAGFVAAPPSAYQDDLAAIYRHHGVTLQNESFGPTALSTLQSDCPDVAELYGTYHALYADLEGAREHATPAAEYAGVALLNVRSAGNDAATLSSMVDNIDCPSDPRNVSYGADSIDIMIGSWTAVPGGSESSPFSNVGPCVGFTAPGDHIVSMSPGGFLWVLSGTSFAAPLTVRHLSMMPVGTTPAQMVEALMVPDYGILPAAWFPAELLYDTASPGATIAF